MLLEIMARCRPFDWSIITTRATERMLRSVPTMTLKEAYRLSQVLHRCVFDSHFLGGIPRARQNEALLLRLRSSAAAVGRTTQFHAACLKDLVFV
jgi:hypothetical protein